MRVRLNFDLTRDQKLT